MSKNRRKLKNLVQKPSLQYRYAVLFFFFTVTGAVVAQILLVASFQRSIVRSLLAAGVDPLLLQMAISDQLRIYTLRIALLFPVLGLAALYLALKITHRFLGPQVPIRRHIAALIEGNYGSSCHLRKGDELQELTEDLNELAATLRERHGEQSSGLAA